MSSKFSVKRTLASVSWPFFIFSPESRTSSGGLLWGLNKFSSDFLAGRPSSVVPADLVAFASTLDKKLQELNSYYYDLIVGNVLEPLEIIPLQKGAFIEYMKSQGKLGGQNKLPRLSNDRKIANFLI